MEESNQLLDFTIPQLLLVGDGPMRDQVKALIRDYGLTTVVRLLGWKWKYPLYSNGESYDYSVSVLGTLGNGVVVDLVEDDRLNRRGDKLRRLHHTHRFKCYIESALVVVHDDLLARYLQWLSEARSDGQAAQDRVA